MAASFLSRQFDLQLVHGTGEFFVRRKVNTAAEANPCMRFDVSRLSLPFSSLQKWIASAK